MITTDPEYLLPDLAAAITAVLVNMPETPRVLTDADLIGLAEELVEKVETTAIYHPHGQEINDAQVRAPVKRLLRRAGYCSVQDAAQQVVVAARVQRLLGTIESCEGGYVICGPDVCGNPKI